MSDDVVMRQYVIYRFPSDYPGKYVVRGWSIVRGGESTAPVADEKPLAVVDTLEEARQAVPPGLFNLGRYGADEHQVVEVWV